MTPHLIHIAPELPPTVGGVADYTAILSRRLVEVSEGAVEPVLVHAGWQSADRIEVDFPVVDLSGQCSAVALANTIEQLAGDARGQTVVLLEYSGYGYAKRGAPFWLARGLRRACGGSYGVPLVAMFHELYATGPVWTSAFWVSILQRYVAGRIAAISRGIASNRADSVKWLQQRTQAPVRHFPVFSNVGEPESLPCHEERDSVAVVFGGTGKDELYQQYGNQLEGLLRRTEIDKVIDIGPSPSKKSMLRVNGLNIEVAGLLPPSEISAHLLKARMGLLCRNPKALTKSGCLAAYMAHGVPAIIALRHSAASADELEEGVHFLTLNTVLRETSSWRTSELKEIGEQAYNWYRRHGHSMQTAEQFMELIW